MKGRILFDAGRRRVRVSRAHSMEVFMRNKGSRRRFLAVTGAVLGAAALDAAAQALRATPELDRQVGQFLDAERNRWDYLNVPYQDGKVLHDLALRLGAKRILEIGTSTGHSTIWLAWAAAKTGGKVTTIEIDRGRHERARANFQHAGVTAYVDARLGDAHELVKTLPGPWDFVFQDADKEWYLQYFLDLDPKMAPGGCYTAHNVARPRAREVREFLARVRADPRYDTRFSEGASSEGISVSCRKGG
ncbi:MAG TPA: class I SAM-dependent methyltransferase [Burkholderiales bacterium]|nr:class I SAM-dependent methyltransferase [Burkholderiales bacterium]